MKNIPFIKMHGLGNDFVIIDCRTHNRSFTSDEIRKISDRHIGVGCDQLVLIEGSERVDCFVRFYNLDGNEVGACGNASRCVAWLMMQEKSVSNVSLETIGGILNCENKGDKLVSVDMGEPKVKWYEIPLRDNIDTLNLPISSGELKDGVAVSMGNPHGVFFVDDVETVNLLEHGSKLEADKLFPEKANISAAQIVSKTEINLRVWERGVGETSACGTGACATVVAANRRNLVGDEVKVNLPGGRIIISYKNNNVIMTGPVATVFNGVLS